jgi:ankyrin repeat protein
LLSSIAGDRGSQWGLRLANRPDAVKPLNVFAYFGLDVLLNELINTDEVALTSSQDGILGNALHWASLGEKESTLRFLLSHRAGSTIIDELWEEYTPLHLSAALRKEDSANLLLDYGASISTRSSLGSTALHLAAQHGLGSIVQRALSNDSWRKVVLAKNIFGRTAFHDSVVPGNAAVIATLLQILDTLPVSAMLDELHDNLRRNPLHVIAESGFADVCRLLLASRYGSRLAVSQDSGKRTPLHVAIAQGQDKVVEEFINWDGGRLFTQIPETHAALLLAARSGQPQVMSALFNSSHKLALLDSNGMTVLHHAANSGDVETVRIVLNKVRRIGMLEATNSAGSTPLFCASERGHAEVVEYFLQEGGARVNATNNDGQEPLHGASRSNLANVVRILLASGADVHAQDSKGQTALAVAAENRALEVAALLLAAGAQLPRISVDSEYHHWLQTHFGQLVEQRLNTRMGITDKDVLDNLYPPQRPKDQFKVYYYVKAASGQRLPPFIISYIIDLAEYWLMNRTQRSGPLMVTELEFYNTPYLRSAPITGNPEYPVRRIEFDITSHDQGWADSITTGWPYDHSYTWFEASREPKQGTTMAKALHLSGPEIVKNVRASREWKRHHVFWPESLVRAFDCDGASDNKQQNATEFYVDPVDNPPILLKWIREIKPGDRVCVHMRARFPGWQNYVSQAEVTVYTSSLLPPGILKRLTGVV